MFPLIDRLARRLLSAADPERGHALALKALRFAPGGRPDPASLRVEAFGLLFPNPVGAAAGFDKNAEAVHGILRAGFGFAEVGTVTPLPQEGNPRPRLFRLPECGGVINRMGFNNQGMTAVRARLAARPSQGIVGVNVGANKDAADRIADYAAGVAGFADVASYFAVNISSPNTPGLRDLQQAEALDALLARVMEARDRLDPARRRPILVKIAPDLALADLDRIVAVARRRDIDGMIVSNTTVTRPASVRALGGADESGGLSGRPLFALSTRILAETFLRAERAFPLIGVGGIDSGAAALAKIRAGATLVQLYTGLVFHGLGLVGDIKAFLAEAIARAGHADLTPLIGVDAAVRSADPWPQ